MTSFKCDFNHLNKTLEHKLILNNENISIHSGEISLLCGENGEGKTTLLRIMAGLIKPDNAQISINNAVLNLRKSRQILQLNTMYLHQFPYMLDRSVKQNLEYVFESTRVPRTEKKLRIEEALEITQLTNISHFHAKKLSGGEQKRVAMARAWLREPKIIFLDEPTANMDEKSCLCTLKVLAQLKQKDIGLIIATHDSSLFYSLTDKKLNLSKGILTTVKSESSAKYIHHIKAA